MLKQFLFVILFLSVWLTNINAQVQEKKRYHTHRAATAPDIDGLLEDACWKSGEWEGDFIQHEPREGIAPTQKTTFCILYDNSNIYIAIKALDTAPDSIVKRMTRRDKTDGDVVGIVFDSYHDLRTGFDFSVSAAGVKQDVIHSEDGNMEDPTWDPIWYVKTSTYAWGWAAEMKIPFTQLRFNSGSTEVWGLNIARTLFRNNELSLWQATPRDASGFIHFMGEMDGFESLHPKKQLDLTPYITAGYENFEKEENNPFADGDRWTKNIGLDGKIGITNNMTLDFTINPDFGQVEADPSEVNLTAFETFFQEKRPFFIEGKNITSFGIGIGDGDIGNDNLFYSRRIGRHPQRDFDLRDNEFSNIPGNTSILGAAKLTGKTEKGWSVGIIESITQKEMAEIDYMGVRRKETAEPLTNYFIGRLQKDFNKGNTIIGGIYTNTLRDLNTATRDDYHRMAHTAGIDFTQFFKDKNYLISINSSFSKVDGTKNAIAQTQESSVHYLQRPDASYLNYDINKTSLNGHGGVINAGKVGGKWNFLFIGLWKSPGLELNDVGYLRTADQLMSIFWGAYHINEPFSVFREMHFNNDYYTMMDYGFNYASSGYEISMSTQFKNYWRLNLHSNINTNGQDKTMLRGGPAMKVPGTAGLHYSLMSDERKKISLELSGGFSYGYDNSQSFADYSMVINYRPFSTLNIELEPEYILSKDELQYIDNYEYDGSPRYLFGHIQQNIFRLSTRINFSITPEFSIQYWGQPFAAAGNFTRIKTITDPKATSFRNRYAVFAPNQMSYLANDDEYLIDENSDGTSDYNFGNPSFNSDEFLSNLVLRWEFLPSSTIYLVWSQRREYSSTLGKFSFENDMKQLFTAEKPYNVFLLKFSYRIGLR